VIKDSKGYSRRARDGKRRSGKRKEKRERKRGRVSKAQSGLRRLPGLWGIRGRRALFSAGHSEGMARKGEELSAPLKSVGTVCN